MTKSLASAILCVASVLSSVGHAAGLDGNRVAVNILYPDKESVFEVLGMSTISDAPSYFDDDGALLAVTSTSITLTYSTSGLYYPYNAVFNGYVLTDLDNSFPAFSLVAASTHFPDLTPDRYFVDGTKFYLNLIGLSPGPGTVAVFNVVPAVPEPASYAMLLAGMGVLGAVARRGKKTPGSISAGA